MSSNLPTPNLDGTVNNVVSQNASPSRSYMTSTQSPPMNHNDVSLNDQKKISRDIHDGETGDHETNAHHSKRWSRKHGFQCPMSIPQIVAMAIYFTNLIITIFVDLPSLPATMGDVVGYIFLAIILLLQIGVFIFALWCTRADPTDPTIYQERDFESRGIPFNDENYDYYCDKCEGHVEERTKHCNRCNRCTKDFDHHCIWMNNCVGYNNYNQFFILIIVYLASCLFQIILQIYMNDLLDSSTESVNEYYNSVMIRFLTLCQIFGIDANIKVVRAFSILSITLSTIVMIPLIYLVWYHIWLKTQGLTTYAHIMLKRRQRLELSMNQGQDDETANVLLETDGIEERKSRESVKIAESQRAMIRQCNNADSSAHQQSHEYSLRFDNNPSLRNINNSDDMKLALSLKDNDAKNQEPLLPQSEQFKFEEDHSNHVKYANNTYISSVPEDFPLKSNLQKQRTSSQFVQKPEDMYKPPTALSAYAGRLDTSSKRSSNYQKQGVAKGLRTEYNAQYSRANSINNNSVIDKVSIMISQIRDPKVYSPKKLTQEFKSHLKRKKTNMTQSPLITDHSDVHVATAGGGAPFNQSKSILEQKETANKAFAYKSFNSGERTKGVKNSGINEDIIDQQ